MYHSVVIDKHEHDAYKRLGLGLSDSAMWWYHRVASDQGDVEIGMVRRKHWNRWRVGDECSRVGQLRSPWPSAALDDTGAVPLNGHVTGEATPLSQEHGLPQGNDYRTSTRPLDGAHDCSIAPQTYVCPIPPPAHPYCVQEVVYTNHTW